VHLQRMLRLVDSNGILIGYLRSENGASL
jgi:hypothetical protein